MINKSLSLLSLLHEAKSKGHQNSAGTGEVTLKWEKTVLVLARHSPKNGVRNKTFFQKNFFFFEFFLGGVV